MRLESTSSSALVLLSSALLALGACGDDGSSGDGGTAGSTGVATDTPTTNSSVDTTGDNPGTTTDDPTTGLDSTGDDMPGTESGSEDSSGDPPMGDCMAGMSFSTLTSKNNDMITQLSVSTLLGTVCDLPVTITATGGTVCAVDDGADGFFYTVETIALEDVPPINCGGIAVVGLTDVSIENTGSGMEVVVPQAGGDMVGEQTIQIIANVEGEAGDDTIDAPLEDFVGVLPEGSVAFGGTDTTVAYVDNSTVVAVSMVMVGPLDATVTLTGLNGALVFDQ